MNVEWRNFDFDTPRGAWVTFPAHHRKGGVRDFVRPLTELAVKRLKRLQQVRPHPRRPFKGAVGYIDRHWRVLCNEAGLPEWVTIHTMRRTHATHLAAAGGDASASLGHSRRDLVAKHYLDPRLSVNRGDLERLPKIVSGK